MSGINLVLFEPEATWKPRLDFPAMTGVKRVCIDLETKDPNLTDLGPGSIRRDGYPVGIGFATDTGFKAYYPIAHEMGGNVPRGPVIQFFTDVLARHDLEVVGHHLDYDLEWLAFLGIRVAGRLRDTGIAEALLDEESPYGYDLNGLAKKWLGLQKDESLLKEAASAYGTDPKTGLWMLHSKYVGSYGETDPKLTLDIYEKQLVELKRQGLEKIHDLESDLIEIILAMRLQGVRVDLEKASLLSKELKKEEDKLYNALRKSVGFTLDVWSNKSIERACSLLNLPVPRTLKGNPSFDKVFLANSDHKFFKQIREVRNINRLRTLFIDDLIFKYHVNGRIHAEFQQLRWEEGGTRSGRFASSNPNLQQIPSRDKVIAPKIRSLFLPNEGELWGKLDYSQQEPRILTHFAYIMKFQGASKMRDAYLNDKTTDFYKLVSAEANLERIPAKVVSLGLMYGEGKEKLARDLGVSVDRAMQIKETFSNANPFIAMMAELAMARAENNGYIKTILGRRRRFDLWEPKWGRNSEYEPPLPMEAAHGKWEGKVPLKRAYTYKALNALIQGSAADMTKAAMVLVYKEMGKIPLLTVHDELDYSIGGEKDAALIQFRMENCVNLTIPINAEPYIGKHWK